MRRAAVALLVACGAVWGSPISADCCRIVKTDSETPPASVRVCEAGPRRSCGTELFSGTLTLGASHEVCTEQDTIVYQEQVPGQSTYGAPIAARCEGGDVEL